MMKWQPLLQNWGQFERVEMWKRHQRDPEGGMLLISTVNCCSLERSVGIKDALACFFEITFKENVNER